MTLPPFYDVSSLEEDRRIDLLGHRAVDHREIIAFITDDDGTHSKGDRYIRKLKEQFPLIEVIDRTAGPVANTETIRIRRKADA
jgi:hypothetical protein